MDAPKLGPPGTDCTAVELDGRVSVHCARTREVQLLDLNATAVWRLLDGTRSLDDVVAALATAYDIADLEALRSDVQLVIAQFVKAGLLRSDS